MREEAESRSVDALAEHRSSTAWLTRLRWLLVFTAVLHVPSLFNPFVTDDYAYIAHGRNLSWSGIVDVLTTGTMDQEASGVWWTPEGVLPFYRPIAILTFAFEFGVWGLKPFWFHLTNLLLHICCTYFVWRLAHRLLAETDGKRREWIAFAAAAIFAIHPAHTEAVLWISCRFDLLAGVFVLASALAYLRWQDEGCRRIRWAILSLTCFAAGLGCKETAVILPAALFVGECLRWRGREAPFRAIALTAYGSAMLVLGTGYLAIRFALFGGLGTLPPPYGIDLSSPSALGDMYRRAAEYLLDFVFFIHPDGIYLDEYWINHPWYLFGLALLAAGLIYWGWRLAGRTRGFSVGLAWAAVFTAPALLSMPGERNIYLSMAGVAVATAIALAALAAKFEYSVAATRRLQRAGMILATVCIAILVFEMGVMWRVSHASQAIYDGLLAEFPNPAPDSRIYVINQPPINAGGFTTAVKLHYDRDDIVACALALAPQLQGTSHDTVYRTGPSSVKIVRHDGYFFRSFIERFLLFSKPESSLPESARRVDLELLNPPESVAAVNELEFRLPYPLEDERMHLLFWDNRNVRNLSDLVWRADYPRLVQCPIEDAPAAVAQR